MIAPSRKAYSSVANKTDYPEVCLLGHADTAFDDPQNPRYHGWLDLSLSDKGQDHAREMAVEYGDEPLAMIFSSDLKRASETAAVIQSVTNAPLVLSRSLRPWDLGVFSGKVCDQVWDQLVGYIRKPSKPIPQGESLDAFRVRFLDYLRSCLNLIRQNPSAGEVLVMTHSLNIRMARAWLKNGQRGNTIDYAVMEDRSDGGPGVSLELEYALGQWVIEGESSGESTY